MTREQKEMLIKVTAAVTAAKVQMAKAEDSIEAAADACKGQPMENILNSIYDELTDLRFDLGKELTNFENRLKGIGNDEPESWKEERRMMA